MKVSESWKSLPALWETGKVAVTPTRLFKSLFGGKEQGFLGSLLGSLSPVSQTVFEVESSNKSVHSRTCVLTD